MARHSNSAPQTLQPDPFNPFRKRCRQNWQHRRWQRRGRRRAQRSLGSTLPPRARHGSGRVRRGLRRARSQGDGRGSDGDQLERVGAGLDPSHADDRKPCRPVAAVDGGQCDGPQSRAREPSGGGREARAKVRWIERHAPDRVHEREPVGARRGRRDGDRRDVREGRRELGVQRLRGRRAGRRDDRGRLVLGLRDVRAREVQLERRRRRSRRAARTGRRSRPRRTRRPRPTPATPSSRSCGRTSPTNLSMPGFASPIEFSIPPRSRRSARARCPPAGAA